MHAYNKLKYKENNLECIKEKNNLTQLTRFKNLKTENFVVQMLLIKNLLILF